ncbi:DUF1853 family protein [Saccharospirillum impatiens]|uniref:DUF1853 family protein n=1 Tax=Saccharospirillum impatiens TaxID=169438 RepID=UPI0003FA5FCB|nr:DUF1853 family protein [Saccharospirillum impatiens]
MDEAVGAQLRQDLTWVLHAPALLPAPELSWNPRDALSDALIEPALEAHWPALEQARHGKLGHYFEALVQTLFAVSPDYGILASNCIVRSPTRTLGELDLLVEDRRQGAIVHLELALKFYLLIPAAQGIDPQCRWIGSGLKDFMTLKSNRLLSHQLSLPERARQENVWPKHLPRPDRSLGWVTGRGFVPLLPEQTLMPKDNAWPLIAPQALIRPWLTESAARERALTGHWINKSQWLSPHLGPKERRKHQPPAQWLGRLPGESQDGHWFIVPDDWPARARDSMLRRFAPANGPTGTPL